MANHFSIPALEFEPASEASAMADLDGIEMPHHLKPGSANTDLASEL
jgi:hypothetical protein